MVIWKSKIYLETLIISAFSIYRYTPGISIFVSISSSFSFFFFPPNTLSHFLLNSRDFCIFHCSNLRADITVNTPGPHSLKLFLPTTQVITHPWQREVLSQVNIKHYLFLFYFSVALSLLAISLAFIQC